MERNNVDRAPTYRCAASGRWLPRTLAASTLIATLLMAETLESSTGAGLARGLQLLVIVVGAVLALWLVRSGGEVRIRVRVDRDGVWFEHSGHSTVVRFDDVERLDYEGPLSVSRRWIPAATLCEKGGRAWRLPTLLSGGERLLAELLLQAGRSDLETWAESLDLSRRMARGPRAIAGGYALAGLILAASLAFYLGWG